jgi:phosphatidate cytidylyltransferase
MPIQSDPLLMKSFGGVLVLLVVASIAAAVLRRRTKDERSRAVIENMVARTNAWWVMSLVFALTLLLGRIGTLILFGLLSFLALREFITLLPTHRADHRTLFWTFFIITPLHYWFVYSKWYAMFTLLIPVYAFLFVPTRIAMAGDTQDFLGRAAKIQWGLMVCVYCLSHAPALLMLNIPGFEGREVRLLFFLVVVIQMSDVLQYVWGKLFGKHKIAPHVSPNKTVEGFAGGILSATGLGTALWWITPFSPWQAAAMSLTITLMGFAGGLVMSGIKRDAGVKDFGALIEGHGGILDRMDSICFAAPVFLHATRFFFTP